MGWVTQCSSAQGGRGSLQRSDSTATARQEISPHSTARLDAHTLYPALLLSPSKAGQLAGGVRQSAAGWRDSAVSNARSLSRAVRLSLKSLPALTVYVIMSSLLMDQRGVACMVERARGQAAVSKPTMRTPQLMHVPASCKPSHACTAY